MFRNRIIVIHPFLFTLFPILSLYADNISQEPFNSVIRSLVVGAAAVGLLLGLLRLVLKDLHRAGLAATLAALMFFGYGSAAHLLEKPAGNRTVWLAVAWVALLLAGEAWIFIRLRGVPKMATCILNAAGAAALAACLYAFAIAGAHALSTGAAQLMPAQPVSAAQPLAVEPSLFQVPDQAQIPVTGEQPPDIYYIILDGHARSDVLSEIYGYNNQPFIDFLQSRGFTVASDSHSNYDQTALSLASSFNFRYLDQMMTLGPTSADRTPLTELINHSAVLDFLKARGYHSVAFSNGFPETELTGADQFIRDPQALNGFELSMLSNTLGGAALSADMVQNYRQRILWEVSELEKQVGQPGPKFVFAHFILPHPPFVFRPDGTPVRLDSADGSQYSGTRAEYHDGYRDEVQYADTLAEQMIISILDHSARPPVIVLQADHGSGLYLDWNSEANTCLRERFSILNAYYLPGKKAPQNAGQNAGKRINPARAPYASITPVNSFRVVFDTYFDADLPLLPDRSFYSTWARPYEMQEVTGKWEQVCPSG